MEEGDQMAIPHLFRCPISLELFTDPVTLCTGQTYDRASIEKWLSAGNFTCPVTMQKLKDVSVVPNHTLRHLINQWLQIDHRNPTINPERSLAAIKHKLESQESSLAAKLQTLETLLVMAGESSSSISSLIQSGLLPMLLELVFRRVEASPSEDHLKIAEQALSCILELLPFDEIDSLNLLKDESQISAFVVLFCQENNIATKINLCNLLLALPSAEAKEICSKLGQNHEFLRQLIDLLDQNLEATEAGLKALSAFCSLQLNLENLVKESAIDGLIAYIVRTERSQQICTGTLTAMAMESIEALLGVESGKTALMNNPNGIKLLVKMVFRVSDHQGSESAINSLMSLCRDFPSVREETIREGVLTQLLLLLQSQCCGRTKTKARLLLKMLRSM